MKKKENKPRRNNQSIELINEIEITNNNVVPQLKKNNKENVEEEDEDEDVLKKFQNSKKYNSNLNNKDKLKNNKERQLYQQLDIK